MPPVLAALPAAAAIGTALGVSAAVGGAISLAVGAALSVGLNFGLQAAFGSKSSSSSNDIGGQTQMLRNSVEPRRTIYGETLVSGVLAYAEVTGIDNGFLDLVVVLAGHQVDSIGDVYFNDKLSTDAQFQNPNPPYYGSFATIVKHLGGDTEADSTLIALSNGKWTSSHKLFGCAYLYVRLAWDPKQKAWPGGIPNISAKVRGKRVYDPRTGTIAWSDNWALCCRDYLLTPMKLGGLGAEEAELDNNSFVAAANLSDEAVLEPDGVGGTRYHGRYTCDGVIKTDQMPKDIMGKLLTAGAGSLVYTQGVYRLFGGSYMTPTVTLTESDLRGPLQVKAKLPRQQLFNTVTGRFVDPNQGYQVVDFPAVGSEDYIAQDGGEEIDNDIDLPFTQDPYAAQRLAVIHLRKSRLGVSVVMPCKLTALQVSAWDVINLSITSLGWVNKAFRVTRFTFSPDGGIDLALQEELASSYTWTTANAITVDIPPETILPTPWDLAAPTGLAITAISLRRADGSIYPVIRVSWTAVSDAYLDHYELGWKKADETVWHSTTIARDSSHFDILNSEEDVTYNIMIRAVNTIGVKSPWATIDGSSVKKGTPPGDPSGLYLLDGLKQLSAFWVNPSDNDLAGIELWYASVNDRSHASMLVFTAANAFSTTASPGTYYCWIRAVDTSGNQSDWYPGGQFSGVEGVSVDEAGAGLIASMPVWKNNFESADFSGWTTSGGAMITQSTDAYRGEFAGLISSLSSIGGASIVTIALPADNLASMAGNRVRVQGWWKQPATGAAAQAGIQVGSSAWFTGDVPTAWGQWGVLYDVPADATSLNVKIWGDTSGLGLGVLVDNLIVFVLSPKIDAANVDQWIGTAAIGDAYIANLDATKITTGVLDAERISAGSIVSSKLADQILSNGSSPFIPSSPAWILDRNGNITIYGGALKIYDIEGNVVLESGTSQGGLGDLAFINQVTGTYIADLAVNTLQIAGEAVTVPRADWSNTTQIAPAGGHTSVAVIDPFPSAGNPVHFTMSVWTDIETAVGLYRDGTQVGYWATTIPAKNTTFLHVDAPGSGSFKYELIVFGSMSSAVSVYQAFLRANEYKR